MPSNPNPSGTTLHRALIHRIKTFNLYKYKVEEVGEFENIEEEEENMANKVVVEEEK